MQAEEEDVHLQHQAAFVILLFLLSINNYLLGAYLQPGDVEGHEADERHDELDGQAPRHRLARQLLRQEARVEVRAVQHGDPHVQQEHNL